MEQLHGIITQAYGFLRLDDGTEIDMDGETVHVVRCRTPRQEYDAPVGRLAAIVSNDPDRHVISIGAEDCGAEACNVVTYASGEDGRRREVAIRSVRAANQFYGCGVYGVAKGAS